MAFGETAELVALLKLKDTFSGPLKSAQRELGNFDAKLSNTQGRAFKAGQQIGTGITNAVKIGVAAVGTLTGLLLLSAKEGQEAAHVQELFANAVANSGKVSATQVAALKAQTLALMNLSGADDEVIKSQQTMLITMGLTGDAVVRLLPLIQDTATATGRDIESVTLAVGKAAMGNATALQRIGIILPKVDKAAKSAALTALEYQKAQLLVAENLDKSHGALTKNEKAYYANKKAALDAAIGQQKLTDAQTKGVGAASDLDTVTNELTKRFGGATRAISGGFDVRLKVLNESLSNLREEAGIKLLPVLTKLVDVTSSRLVPAFGTLLDRILPGAIAGLTKLAGFLEGGGATEGINSLLKTAGAIAPVIQQAAEVTGFVVKTAVDLFRSLPPEIQSLAVAGLAVNKLTGGLVTNIAGGLISAVISSFRGLMNVNAAVVNVNGPVAGLGAPAALGAGALAAIAAPLAAAAAVAITAKLQQDNVDQQASDLKLQTLTFAKTASDAALAQSIDGVRKTLASLGEGPTSNPFNVKGQTTEVLNLLIAELNRRTVGGPINPNGGVGNQPYGPTTQAGINRFGGVGNQPYGPMTTMTEAVKSNTAALEANTRQLHGDVTGLLTVRSRTRGQHKENIANLLAEARTIIGSSAPVATKIAELIRIQKHEEGHRTREDTKLAHYLAGEVRKLKTTVTVNLANTFVLNGRLIEAATGRFITTTGRMNKGAIGIA